MPSSDVAVRHSIRVAASPAQVYEVTRRMDLGRLWTVRALMAIRSAPAWIAAALRGAGPAAPRTADRRHVGGVGFTLIAERPGEEFVLGIMGRFWTVGGGVVSAEADAFHQAPPPGLAQAVWNFRVEPTGAGTELSTETRVRCGDAASRRRFMRYWRVIRPGSSLIRRSLLKQIRRTAERGGEPR